MKLFWLVFNSILLLATFVFVAKNNFGVAEVVTSTPQVAAVSTTRIVSSGDIFIDEVNRVRAEKGIEPLLINKSLSDLANSRREDMIARLYYSHINPEGKAYSDFLPTKGGFSCENLNLDSDASTKASINAWLTSKSGHKECLLSPQAVSIGYSSGMFVEETNSYLTVMILGSN